MKVKLLSNLDHSGVQYKTGEEIDLGDTAAQQLVADGVVAELKEKPADEKKKIAKTEEAQETPKESETKENPEQPEDKPVNRMSHAELIAYGEEKFGLKDLDKLKTRNEVRSAIKEAEAKK